MKKTTHALPVPLTPDDLLERAERIAWVIAEIQEAADELKAAKDVCKERLEGLSSRELRLAQRIRNRNSPQLELQVVMTTDDVVDTADDLVRTMAAIGEAERELDEAKKAHKLKDQELNHEKVQLASEIRDRKAMRQVPVEWRPNHGAGVVELWRMDTGELVERRLMSDFEAERDFDSVGLAAH